MKGTIVVITGPSCSGKSHLEAKLVKDAGFKRIISHTTRMPRPGELDGISYHFIDSQKFKEMKDAGEFAETAEFGGASYGATKEQFEIFSDAGHSIAFVAEPEGREQIISYAEDNNIPILPVFVTNPADVIAARFIDRFAGEFAMAVGRTDGNLIKVLDRAAKRLGVMLGEEREWQPAEHYNGITFGRYDANNENLAVSRIVEQAMRVSESQPAKFE